MSPEAIEHLSKVDPVLARIIQQAGPIRWKSPRQNIFVALIEAVTRQQLSEKAAQSIFGRVRRLSGTRAFPAADYLAGIATESLRAAGLSRPKAEFVKDIASRMARGLIPQFRQLQKVPDEEIIARLTEIRGVGRWTVEMLLMFNMGRPDVLPVDDLALRRGFQCVFGKRTLPTPEQVMKYGERWKPYRTTASRYLWRSLSLSPEPRP